LSRFPHPKLTAPSWLRLPRRTARLRLTLLAGALFLLSGATLLTVTYLLFVHASSHGSAHTPAPSPPGFHRSHSSFSSETSTAAQRLADQHDLLIASALGLALVAVFALLLGWFVAGRMLRPVRAITATARRISATNLHERLSLHGADEEFKELGDTLDDLFGRLGAAFEAQQHFVANASHELRTPLTAERALLQVALDDPHTTNAAWRSTAEEVLASSDEQERLIEALLTLASSQGGLDRLERIDLAVICNDVLTRPNPDIDRLGLHVETAIGPAPLDGDPRLVERLVANLVDNAINHNVNDGDIQIATTFTDGKAVVSVTNTGPVVPAGEIDRLFRPFQRLDPHRAHHKGGHGLGLSIVRAVADAHGATVNAKPTLGGGLGVEIAFPPPVSTNGRSGSSPRSDRTNEEPRPKSTEPMGRT
jgi:signal transduction histidine kinase